MIAAFSINCVHKVKIKIPLNMKRVNRGPRSKSSLVKLGGYISIKFKRFRGLYQVVCTGYQGGFGLVFGCYQVNVAFCTPDLYHTPTATPTPAIVSTPTPTTPNIQQNPTWNETVDFSAFCLCSMNIFSFSSWGFSLSYSWYWVCFCCLWGVLLVSWGLFC